jgi:DUF4097 and DUF4098 domain-containing protein YvlB
MNLRILLALSIVLPATAALAAEGTFDKTFAVNSAPSVSVSSGSGYIHIYPGSGNQVHIVGHVHSNSGWFGPDADARVREIVASPPITQSGNTITVSAPSDADSELFRHISIDYDVTTPRATALKARTGSGSIEIGGIETAVTASSGSGSIHTDNIGADSRLETGSGGIKATNVHGAAMLRTGSGSIELALAAPGDVNADTGSGSIHIDGIVGGLRARAGSGSIDVRGNPTSDWRAESGSGSIHLQIPPDAHFDLNAETGSGSVHTDRPILMQGSLNNHHITGSVNGGGPIVRASTGSGSIDIR